LRCSLENHQTRLGLFFVGKLERNFFVVRVSATLDVRGLSLRDQTRAVARRHHDRLLVSLHRAVVSGWLRT
jgi:hypothetical protein